MNQVDYFVDALEDAIAERGVLSVDIQELVRSLELTALSNACERSRLVVELLRVWMEHRWSVDAPVSTEECLSLFPSMEFTQEDEANLRTEEQRQGAIRGRDSIARGSQSLPIAALPEVGQTWDEFELLAELGHGAFAKVYLAKQNDLAGRLVALKLTFRESFESHWLASLQHSAIVPIYSTHRVGQVYGICMPYLGNTTLADLQLYRRNLFGQSNRQWWVPSTRERSATKHSLLNTIRLRHSQIDTLVASTSSSFSNAMASHPAASAVDMPQPSGTPIAIDAGPCLASQDPTEGQTPLAEWKLLDQSYVRAILWIGVQMADALAYAHAQGIVHSDVKPANVLLGKDGQPRLLDFNVSFANRFGPEGRGHSKGREPQLPLGGTIPYMSPELRRSLQQDERSPGSGSGLDERSDVYSLGVVLFELLTGRLPQFGSRLDKWEWDPSISPATRRILSKCLEVDPNQRYKSARCLGDDLRAHLEHRPLIHQREPSWLERGLKWTWRNPRASSSLSVASCALVLLATLFTGFWLRGKAIQKADWMNRLAVLEQKMPNALSLVSSLRVVPELESQASVELTQLLTLIAKDGQLEPDGTMQVDPRWRNEHASFSMDARKSLGQLVRIARDVHWDSQPNVLRGLDLEMQNVALPDVAMQEDPSAEHWSLVRDGQIIDALRLLLAYVDAHPRDYFSWWLMGDCQQAMQEFNDAERSYTVCIAMQPEIPVAYFNRGMARSSQQRWELACKDYSQALSLAPQWPQCRLNKALCLQAMGKPREAVLELDAAIQEGYGTVSVYRLRAELHAQLGDQEMSIRDAQAALATTPYTEPQWIDHGLLQLDSHPARSVADFQEALRINARSIDARQKLAYTFSELLNDPNASLEQLGQLIDLDPSQPAHRAGRAVLNSRLGKVSLAEDDLRALETMRMNDPMVVYQVACIYSLLGQHASKSVADPGVTDPALDATVRGPHDSNAVEQHRADAMRWLARSAFQDWTIVSVAATDPDLHWLREQDEFGLWYQAIQSLHSFDATYGIGSDSQLMAPSSSDSNP